MRYIITFLLILFFLSNPLFAESERPQTIVIPISSLGAVTKSQKQILQNTLEDNLKTYFTLISQELFEKAQEKAFEELDYEECTEDQCIMLIQEMLQVENVFHLQVIREGQNTQLSLSWRTLDEKKKETDVCKNCDTFEINDRINKLLLIILGKVDDQDRQIISKNKNWLRFYSGTGLISVYYKFTYRFGLGLSSITSHSDKNVCDSFKANGTCHTEVSKSVIINGTFLQLGYDLEFNPIVYNINLGLALDGKVQSESRYHYYDREIDKSSSYTLFTSLAYRGEREYGVGFNYTSLKQKGENNHYVCYFNSNFNCNRNLSTSDSHQKTETRTVLWFGLNW